MKRKAIQKTDSVKIVLRLPPELHARLAAQAQAAGRSLNSLIVEILGHLLLTPKLKKREDG